MAELAARLGVAASDLERWIAGVSPPPHEVFFTALDIVAGVEQNRRRAERFANLSQQTADRAQAAADRIQARADRLRTYANRLRRAASRQSDEQLRTMSSDEQNQASNQPDEKLKKEKDSG